LWIAGACALAFLLLASLARHTIGSIYICALTLLAAAGAAALMFAVTVLKINITGSSVYLIDLACFGAPPE
jgi:hypothetical protein